MKSEEWRKLSASAYKGPSGRALIQLVLSSANNVVAWNSRGDFVLDRLARADSIPPDAQGSDDNDPGCRNIDDPTCAGRLERKVGCAAQSLRRETFQHQVSKGLPQRAAGRRAAPFTP